jgi:pimeloyl-ACP methyl ester carboxylesterase
MNPVAYRTIQIDGLSIFYRDAGAKNAQTLLLLHRTSVVVPLFETLFARLSDRYHLIAPDYPGFRHSDCPRYDREQRVIGQIERNERRQGPKRALILSETTDHRFAIQLQVE